MNISIRLVSIVLLLTLTNSLFAQDVVSGSNFEKSFQIVKLTEAPKIDGILDEELWSQATLVEDFHQISPIEYSAPSQPTKIWLFYTEDALYIGARMYMDNAEDVTANTLKQGGSIFSDDYIGFSIDPYLDRRSGYAFSMNPNGVRWDALFKNITEFVMDWDGLWHSEGHIDDEGWTAEIRVPFRSLSFNPETTTWGFNFERWIAKDSEWIGWVSREHQMNPSINGTAIGFEGLQQGMGLDLIPSITARQDRNFTATPGDDQSFEPSLDAFYKITPQLNASLTINTDFSAADVDSRQVNLTRFGLFFPEQRSFFLQDADIFDFGRFGGSAGSQNARPFFSRTIGLNSVGEPVDINYGGKLSGRIGQVNIGTMLIRQDEDISTNVDSQSIFVGRASTNVLTESTLGVILTDGDPHSNLDNTLIGADFNYRNSRLANGKILEAFAWYQQSDSEGITGNDSSYGFGISAPNSIAWRGSFAYKKVEENFNPAMGFVNRAGIQDFNVDVGYYHLLEKSTYFRSLFTGFESYRAETLFDGRVSSASNSLAFSMDNNTGDNASLRFIESREVLNSPFLIYGASDGSQLVIIPAGDYSFTEVSTGLNFGGHRKVSGGFTLRGGDYYDGNHFSRSVNITLKPSPHFQARTSYTEDEIKLPDGDFTLRLLSFKADIAFSSHWSWSNLIQYDNFSENIGFNSRLHWYMQAGQEAFLVFNYGLQDRDKNNSFESTNSDLSLKFSYTLRF